MNKGEALTPRRGQAGAAFHPAAAALFPRRAWSNGWRSSASGRPSTYASIIQVLQDRDYVKIDKKRFVPEDRGRLVTAFLSSFFDRLVQYNSPPISRTSSTRSSGGRIDWKKVLREFWEQFLACRRRHQRS